MDGEHTHHAGHFASLYDQHDQWAAQTGLFYGTDTPHYLPAAVSVAALTQPASLLPLPTQQQQPHDSAASGIVTRQRARQQQQQQILEPPVAYSSADFQSLNAIYYPTTQSAFHSPPFPSTPVSSAPSSRATYYSSSGPRSASPAVSVASTSLTSLSGGHQAPHPYIQQHPVSPVCTPPTSAPAVPSGTPDAAEHVQLPDSANIDLNGSSEGIDPSSGPRRSRKSRLYNLDRKAICCYAKNNPEKRQEDIAARYGVERSTISKILKQKEKWMNMPEGDDMSVIKHRPSKFPALEKRLMIILKQCTRDKVPLTDLFIRVKAKEVAKEIGISEDKFKASSGWVENFKHRHNVRRGVLVGRPAGRNRKHGSDGELTGDEESDWEDRVMPGEEGMTHEERLAHREAKKTERVQLFRIADQQIMEEHGDQIAAGLIDEELRMELVLARRAALLRAKNEGKTLEELDKANEIIPEPVHSRLEADMLSSAGPSNGKPRAFVIVPRGVSGVTPYGSDLQPQPSRDPIGSGFPHSTPGYFDQPQPSQSAALPLPTHSADFLPSGPFGQQDSFGSVAAALDFLNSKAESFLTQGERELLYNLRQRVQRTAGTGPSPPTAVAI